MNPLERIAGAASGAVNQAAAGAQRGIRSTFSRQRLQDQVATGITSNSNSPAAQAAGNAVQTGRSLARTPRRARAAGLILSNPAVLTALTVVAGISIFFLLVVVVLGSIINISGNDNVQTAVAQAKERGCDFAKGCNIEQYLQETGCALDAEQLAKATDAISKLPPGSDLKQIVCPSSASSSSAASN